MKDVLKLTFASSLTEMCNVNQSFDKGVLRVCYTGKNRNGSFISKETLENALKTISNCPVVCNYDRDTDSLGGHDMSVEEGFDGELELVNLTQPVGVIPESAKQWFDVYEDENGVEHEYLYTEVLLWKRQEAYQKIKRDGVCKHSMEISVNDGRRIDGLYHINDFEFTAFALIGVEPCYESSALEVFSLGEFKAQMAEMMADLKETFSLVITPDGADDTKRLKGGTQTVDEKLQLAEKFGVDVDALDFSLEDFTIEELTEKFEAMKTEDPVREDFAEDTADNSDDNQDEPAEEPAEEPEQDFALNSDIVSALCTEFEKNTISCEWGEMPAYLYVDFDLESKEVYCWSSNDWLLYGMPFEMNGDNAVIDFAGCKRKKYAIVDFDEGEQVSPFADTYSAITAKFAEIADIQEKFEQASAQVEACNKELETLRAFKADADKAVIDAQRAEVFAQFDDLEGVEAFEALKEDCEAFDLEALEEKCFAIRGRLKPSVNFSLEPKAPKLIVGFDKADDSAEPYGGLFKKYNVGQK